jgi:hypothetical protein
MPQGSGSIPLDVLLTAERKKSISRLKRSRSQLSSIEEDTEEDILTHSFEGKAPRSSRDADHFEKDSEENVKPSSNKRKSQ